jgi:hypothetical protein
MKRRRTTTMIRVAISDATLEWVDEVRDCIEELSGERPPRASLLSSLIEALRQDDEARAHFVNVTVATASCH